MIWLQVVERLVALLPTLPGWDDVAVFDGPPSTQARPKRYAIVGYIDDADGAAGSYSQTASPLGNTLLDEQGSVVVHLVVQVGSVDLPSVRAAAFALVGALEQALRADRRLGVLPPSATTSLDVSVQPRTAGGTAQSLVLIVNYTART